MSLSPPVVSESPAHQEAPLALHAGVAEPTPAVSEVELDAATTYDGTETVGGAVGLQAAQTLVEGLSGLLSKSGPPFVDYQWLNEQGGTEILKNLVDPTFLEKNDVYRQLDAMPFVPSPPSICVAPVSSAAFITECGSTPIFIDDASLCLSIPLCPTSSTDVTLTEHTVAYVEVKRGVVDARRDLVALLEGGEMAAVETGAVREWWNFPGWGKNAPGPADEPKKIYLATKTFHPAHGRISLAISWWGYSLYLPHVLLASLGHSVERDSKILTSISDALNFLLSHLPYSLLPPYLLPAFMVLKSLAPLLPMIAEILGWGWTNFEKFDLPKEQGGLGIVLRGTWVLPGGVVPGSWRDDAIKQVPATTVVVGKEIEPERIEDFPSTPPAVDRVELVLPSPNMDSSDSGPKEGIKNYRIFSRAVQLLGGSSAPSATPTELEGGEADEGAPSMERGGEMFALEEAQTMGVVAGAGSEGAKDDSVGKHGDEIISLSTMIRDAPASTDADVVVHTPQEDDSVLPVEETALIKNVSPETEEVQEESRSTSPAPASLAPTSSTIDSVKASTTGSSTPVEAQASGSDEGGKKIGKTNKLRGKLGGMLRRKTGGS